MSGASRRPILLLMLAAVLSGCGSQVHSHGAEAQGSITVFAAASLTGPFTRMGADYEKAHSGTTIQFNFAGSATLATQLRQGAIADVFASADQPTMRALAGSGQVRGSPSVFARNRLEIVVAAGNPKHIEGLRDLSRANVIVVLCAEVVPCGRYGAEALRKAGVAVKPASLETDVKSVLGKVALGEADAGIVYVTDVIAGGSRVEGVAIPDDQNVMASYPIAVLNDSSNTGLALAFMNYVLAHDGGQRTLHQYGFLEA